MQRKYFKFGIEKYSGNGGEICLPTLDFNLMTIKDGFQNKLLKNMILSLSKIGVSFGFKKLEFYGNSKLQHIFSTIDLSFISKAPIAYYDGDIYDIQLTKNDKNNDDKLINSIKNKDKLECPICHKKLTRNKRVFITNDYQLIGVNCLLSKVLSEKELKELYFFRKIAEKIYLSNLQLMISYGYNPKKSNYGESVQNIEDILKNQIYIPITEKILTPEQQNKFYSTITDYMINALLNKIINSKPFNVSKNYNPNFKINNSQGKVLLLMRSIYNGYLSNLSITLIKNIGQTVVSNFIKERTEQASSLTGKIVYGDVGYDNSSPSFYRIKKQTEKTVTLEKLYSKVYSGNINDVRYFVIPDENNVDTTIKEVRKQIKYDRQGRFHCMINGRSFSIWDGKPKEANER